MRRKLRIRPWLERLGFIVDQRRWRMRRRNLHIPVVGVTGSSGKTTTTILLDHLLNARGTVATLSIENTLSPLTRFLAKVPSPTDFIVAEVGATVIGSVAELVRHLRPTVGIVTKIGIEHYSAFRNKEMIAREKENLVAALPDDGLAVLNADDPHVMSMASRSRARVVTFGRSGEADYRVVETFDGLPDKMRLRIACARGTYEIQTPFLDESFWLGTAAAFACAVELGVDPETAAGRIATAKPARLRLQWFEVEGGPTFILDTTKAPAESIEPTLKVLKKARAAFKTVVLGAISDYAGNPRKPYKNAYQLGIESADRVIFVGDNIHRAPATDEERENCVYAGFVTPQQVSQHIQATARPGELILVKGSKNLHLERIGLSWTTTVHCWEPKCGKSIDCIQCGMLEFPYEQHGRLRRAAKWAGYLPWRAVRKGPEKTR